MDNVYLKKLFTWKGLGLVLLIILINSTSTYTKNYIMDYFTFDELTQMISLGPISIQLSWIISTVLTLLLVGIHEGIFFRDLMNKLFDNKLV